MKKTKILYIAFISIFLLQIGCTEPFEIETLDYESVLVVESTITDELKPQIVKLSRTSTLESSAILTENDATVIITGNTGESYSFSQDVETGVYISNEAFSAQPNVLYTLNIKTSNARNYSSSTISLTPEVAMEKVFVERVVDPVDNKDGVQVLVTTKDPTGQSQYFRYEYEETYKVIAPYPSSYTFEIINFDVKNYTYEVVVTPREPEITCYTTELSTGILQTATENLNDNQVLRFPVRYLSKEDAKLQTRYSLLVKQFVQSVEAYTFYKKIKELGSIQSLLSQSQPGYVRGNITSENDPDEKVLGFFDASSVTSKRIYFNYEDFGLEKPPYFVACNKLVLDYRDNSTLDNDPNEREIIYTYLKHFDYQIVDYGQPFLFTIAKQECSVCTSFSSNVKPDFWVD